MEHNRYRLVVSSENNPYMAWQTKLFYYSCVSRLKHQPLIILHESGSEVCPDFHDITRGGGIVRVVPSYERSPSGETYPPRNTAGTLLHAAQACQGEYDFIVLCDPDMIFVRETDFAQQLSGGHYPYLDYSSEEVQSAARQLGIQPQLIEAHEDELRCGVPYVIPVAEAYGLAKRWLAAVDMFSARGWTDIMYAFGLAAIQAGMRISLMNGVDFNCYPESKLTGFVIHYCYGNQTWDKRHYVTAQQAGKVWEPAVEGAEGTVLKEIVSQLREAKQFYRNHLYPFDRDGPINPGG
jgi:hypothetical protein